MRYAVLILLYDCDRFILRTVANAAPHVEKIYISYSPQPWAYNLQARKTFPNPSDPNLLNQSPYREMIDLVEGDWLTEEDQRNDVLEKARFEGFDYLLVQDADEFFHDEDYQANLRSIEQNPDFSYYRTPWYQFWKDLNHVVLCRFSNTYRKGKIETSRKNTIIGYSMAFALNLRKPVYFEHCRRPSTVDDYLILEGVCFHLSFVMDDEQVVRKIKTYGHSNQVRHRAWLRFKWYGWCSDTKNLHPIDPLVWLRTVPFTGTLPREIQDFPELDQKVVPLQFWERIAEIIYDWRARSLHELKCAKAGTRRVFARFLAIFR